ncbi:FecR family protein [Chitinophaga agrisoli]|uniref:FecR family protein n=1 Tax=Chitinophaga agrisoli TaxID=2607653 RepID=A0A5B2VJ57_9BACT|nr:FecR domain-containing protein [Chitinophaga agrisoli]KAA2238944.1 FecR family protein [Chitinophaga agrisoli]
MKNERLIYLFERYAQQQQTDVEMAELQQFLADERNEEQVKAVIDEYFTDQTPVYKMKTGVADDILTTILQTQEEATTAVVRALPRRRHTSWWAAAAVVAVCGAGIYIWQRPAAQQAVPAASVATLKHNGRPGGNKATLTLADGSVISLDSTGHQTIPVQGGAIQQHNGQLAYTVTQPKEASYNVLSIPRGGQFQLVLPDGTKVWLNAASSLRYPTAFTGKERVVELTGEAYFEIAQNETQPFKVTVGVAAVTALGTSFNVMAYADESNIHTTLVSGAVQVSCPEGSKVLQPGMQSVWNKTTHVLHIQDADIDRTLAWKSGFFELDNTDLPTIMRQLARWYDIEIIDQSKGKTAGLFGGRISRDVNLTDVLHVLERYGVRFSIEGNKVTILP